MEEFLLYFISETDFHLSHNLSIAINSFLMGMLTSLSVDEIFLLRCVNWLINFRGLPFNVKLAPSCLKLMSSVLSDFTKRSMPLASCSRLCCRDLRFVLKSKIPFIRLNSIKITLAASKIWE